MTVLEKLNPILNTKSPEGGEAIPLVDAFGKSNHMLEHTNYLWCSYTS